MGLDKDLYGDNGMHCKAYNTLVDLLEYRSSAHPDKTAYIFLDFLSGSGMDYRETSITNGELYTNARKIAERLERYNGCGERAIMLYPPGIDYIVAFYACLLAGIIAVPSYPPMSEKFLSQVKSIVADATPKFVLSVKTVSTHLKPLMENCINLRDVVWFDTDGTDEKTGEEFDRRKYTPYSTAFLQYTSGATAHPRGVKVTHENLLHNLSLIERCFGHHADSCGVIWLPPYHDMGLIGGILQPLYAGFPVVLMSPLSFLKNPLRWLWAISNYKATTSGGPNFAYDLCIRKITPEQKNMLNLSSWDLAFNGAEPIKPDTLERFVRTFAECGFREESFYPCYGLAESTLIVTGGIKENLPKTCGFSKNDLLGNRVTELNESDESHKKYVGCGNALHKGEVIIVDTELSKECMQGKIGEIWVRSPSVAAGYWNNELETARVFNACLADTGEGPYLRTGDLGFIHDEELFVAGRLKDVIIIRGENYYPQDIETVAEQSNHLLRKGCGAAFTVGNDGETRIVLVQEVAHLEEKIQMDSVIQDIRQAVALYQGLYIDALALIQCYTIPKTTSGKIQRNECRTQYLSGTLEIVWHDTTINN